MELIQSIIDTANLLKMSTGKEFEIQCSPKTFRRLYKDVEACYKEMNPKAGLNDVTEFYYEGVLFKQITILSWQEGFAILEKEVVQKED